MTIIEVKEKLSKAFKDIPVMVLDKEEDKKWCIENDVLFEAYAGDYLIVMDKDEEDTWLGGAYEITCENGAFDAIWLSYPEEPITDIDIFIANVLMR